jgi:hypothetical protein|tara:strand:- start:15893 stop:16342 length:450 start_codon:yes stop_codon:yes gene_type:complete
MGFVQKEWLVYFYESDKDRYSDFMYFLKKGFKHCGAIGYVPDIKRWVHLEWTHEGITHHVLEEQEMANIISFLYDYKMLRCPVKTNHQLFRIKDFTCVSFIMKLIGFYKWYILTPYQLFCALQKNGYSSFYDNIRINNDEEEKNTRSNH